MSPDLVDAVKADLADYHAEFESPAVREVLVRHGFTRLRTTLELVPERLRDADVLQLGAEPYLLTLCLRRLFRRQPTLANYFGTTATHGEQLLVSRRTGDVLRLPYRLFNVETEDFPYADASFDVVFFCELLEHLAIDPVRALADIHRVLRPDGVLVVTTPNCRSAVRLDDLLRARRQMVDRYSPGFGYGARHNREYLPAELRELLECTGFVVEEFRARDLAEPPRGERMRRAVWRRLLRWYSDQPQEEHLFVRARRAPRFRWRFPPGLFDNLEFYVLARHPWVEMGVNDSIQCVFGWSPLERGDDGSERRWVRGTAQAVVKCPAGASRLRADCLAGAGRDAIALRIAVRHRRRWQEDPRAVYADELVSLVAPGWRTVELPLRGDPPPGEEVEICITPTTDVPARSAEVAVRRLELAGGI